MRRREITIVSFSGIDGAGKSTQIEALCQFLRRQGVRCRVLRFWDDVAALSRFRELATSMAFNREPPDRVPNKPILRHDKNVVGWYMTAVRLLLYLLDALSLFVVHSRNVESDYDVLIFDRYLYDQLANLPLQHVVTRSVARALLGLAPKPNIPLLLDAEPETAAARKPEYPLQFVRRNRDAYLHLSRMAGLRVIPPLSVEETSAIIGDMVLDQGLRSTARST